MVWYELKDFKLLMMVKTFKKEVVYIDNINNINNLINGKVYLTELSFSGDSKDEFLYYQIINDNGKKCWEAVEYFLSIVEYRERILNGIIDDC